MKLNKTRIWIASGILVVISIYLLLDRPSALSSREAYSPTNQPQQQPVQEPVISLSKSGFNWKITPKAWYRIAARVLSTERYYFGWQSTLSPVDVALAWGDLSNKKADEWVRWSQSGRWYFFRWSGGCPYSSEQIIRQSANVHIIPANVNVRKAALELGKNDVVFLEGYLVNVDGTNGSSSYWWRSSMSRTDTGDGSCELLYLKRMLHEGKEYF